jgi:hypothetical protein
LRLCSWEGGWKARRGRVREEEEVVVVVVVVVVEEREGLGLGLGLVLAVIDVLTGHSFIQAVRLFVGARATARAG